MSDTVCAEIHRAKAFIRLLPIETPPLLCATWVFDHDTVPLVIQHFMHRFPQRGILLVNGTKAWLGKDGEIEEKTIDPRRFKPPVAQEDFLPHWLTFYNSQTIPQRRNLRLLKHHIPQKYWGLMPEMRAV
jgi:probable DNA metabolism protein